MCRHAITSRTATSVSEVFRTFHHAASGSQPVRLTSCLPSHTGHPSQAVGHISTSASPLQFFLLGPQKTRVVFAAKIGMVVNGNVVRHRVGAPFVDSSVRPHFKETKPLALSLASVFMPNQMCGRCSYCFLLNTIVVMVGSLIDPFLVLPFAHSHDLM